jgi:hypothetical protein
MRLRQRPHHTVGSLVWQMQALPRQGGSRVTADTVPLKLGLTAHYFTHADIAAHKRRQRPKKPQHNNAQLELDETDDR